MICIDHGSFFCKHSSHAQAAAIGRILLWIWFDMLLSVFWFFEIPSNQNMIWRQLMLLNKLSSILGIWFPKKVLDSNRIWLVQFMNVFTTIRLYLLTWACLASILRPLGPVLDLVVFFKPLFDCPRLFEPQTWLISDLWNHLANNPQNRVWLRSQYVLFVSHLHTLTERGGSALGCMLWQSWTQVRASHGFDLALLRIEMLVDARIIKSYTSSGLPSEDHPKTYWESSQ